MTNSNAIGFAPWDMAAESMNRIFRLEDEEAIHAVARWRRDKISELQIVIVTVSGSYAPCGFIAECFAITTISRARLSPVQ